MRVELEGSVAEVLIVEKCVDFGVGGPWIGCAVYCEVDKVLATESSGKGIPSPPIRKGMTFCSLLVMPPPHCCITWVNVV